MSHALSQRATIEPPRPNQALKYIVLGTIVLNALGFALYKKLQLRKESEAAVAVVAAPAALPVAQPSTSKGAAGASLEDEGKRDLARAHRASGLAALESGDYALAVRSFTSALKLSTKNSDTAELLKIAKELQERAKAAAKAVPVAAPAEPTAVEPAADAAKKGELARSATRPTPKPSSRASTRRVASVTPAREEPDAPAPQGTLLVTSTPSGLLVEVDGRSMDLTPAKIRLDPGSHVVALLRGSTRLHERRIEVTEDSVLSVDVDVTPALRAERAVRQAAPADDELEGLAEPESARAASPVTNAAATRAASSSGSRAIAPAPGAAASGPAGRSGAVGDLHVASSGVYGDVWINGIAFGPPPVLAKNVAAGAAKVEIRVGGNTRRSKTVEVSPGQRTTLRLR